MQSSKIHIFHLFAFLFLYRRLAHLENHRNWRSRFADLKYPHNMNPINYSISAVVEVFETSNLWFCFSRVCKRLFHVIIIKRSNWLRKPQIFTPWHAKQIWNVTELWRKKMLILLHKLRVKSRILPTYWGVQKVEMFNKKIIRSSTIYFINSLLCDLCKEWWIVQLLTSCKKEEWKCLKNDATINQRFLSIQAIVHKQHQQCPFFSRFFTKSSLRF